MDDATIIVNDEFDLDIRVAPHEETEEIGYTDSMGNTACQTVCISCGHVTCLC